MEYCFAKISDSYIFHDTTVFVASSLYLYISLVRVGGPRIEPGLGCHIILSFLFYPSWFPISLYIFSLLTVLSHCFSNTLSLQVVNEMHHAFNIWRRESEIGGNEERRLSERLNYEEA
jgi:hypothetical protein